MGENLKVKDIMKVKAQVSESLFGKMLGGKVLDVCFSNPEKRNVIDRDVIARLTEVFSSVPQDVKAVVLRGEGKVFCAGGDLRWMLEEGQKSFEGNFQDALSLARMYKLIWSCPLPVLSCVRGGAWGGGVGFLAVSDIVVTHRSAKFATPEVKIGLVPAVISVFLKRKIGVGRAKFLALSGIQISSNDALRLGLVDVVVDDDRLEDEFVNILNSVLEGGKRALSLTKELFQDEKIDEELHRASLSIALARAGEEGREGIKAFFEKRKPSWVKK